MSFRHFFAAWLCTHSLDDLFTCDKFVGHSQMSWLCSHCLLLVLALQALSSAGAEMFLQCPCGYLVEDRGGLAPFLCGSRKSSSVHLDLTQTQENPLENLCPELSNHWCWSGLIAKSVASVSTFTSLGLTEKTEIWLLSLGCLIRLSLPSSDGDLLSCTSENILNLVGERNSQ